MLAAFKTLCDAAQVLKVLHDVGWLHRDVSTGNVLSFNGQGKLLYLDYAQNMATNSGHEVRAGTVNFMACEIEGQRYLFYEKKQATTIAMIKAQTVETPSFEFHFNPYMTSSHCGGLLLGSCFIIWTRKAPNIPVIANALISADSSQEELTLKPALPSYGHHWIWKYFPSAFGRCV
ncbi:hypothetical protein BJ138DRAFT_134422 [Hygrophoropsis aurantiaca]|uniref:Uncharacterized protein n=1 Tax=Hygrophoropsis aurantiaca TaxID=72124 RepID=A0ACB8AAU4_9AGAM|nr:hypothetical protein BJ138DRAFT_134422 [Hygrophoropsis aurantiaca]